MLDEAIMLLGVDLDPPGLSAYSDGSVINKGEAGYGVVLVDQNRCVFESYIGGLTGSVIMALECSARLLCGAVTNESEVSILSDS